MISPHPARCVCVYVCVCVCVCVCMCACACVLACARASTCRATMSSRRPMRSSGAVCVCGCVCVCTYLCVYLYTYAPQFVWQRYLVAARWDHLAQNTRIFINIHTHIFVYTFWLCTTSRRPMRLFRTVSCNTLQHTATHCNTLQHTAPHCNTLQHTATHCNTLQHTATHGIHKCIHTHTYSSILIDMYN